MAEMYSYSKCQFVKSITYVTIGGSPGVCFRGAAARQLQAVLLGEEAIADFSVII